LALTTLATEGSPIKAKNLIFRQAAPRNNYTINPGLSKNCIEIIKECIPPF